MKTSLQREQRKDSIVSKESKSGTSQSDDSMGKNLLVATTSYLAKQMRASAVNINLQRLGAKKIFTAIFSASAAAFIRWIRIFH
jgi:hypothetical protein